MSETWQETVRRMRFTEGRSWGEMALEMEPAFPGLTSQQVREKVRGYCRSTSEYNSDHQPAFTRNTVPFSINLYEAERIKYPGTVKFGVVSDNHLGSLNTQLTMLHTLYDRFSDEGCQFVLNAGDITDGLCMREGHSNDLYVHSADEYKQAVIDTYPVRSGLKSYVISGNHDANLYKKCGYDLLKGVADLRKDIVYLGRDVADVWLTPYCKARLLHPWDGASKTLSHALQKHIDSMDEDRNPDILFVGHHHKYAHIYFNGIEAYSVPTTCSRTPFMVGKGIKAYYGGLIIEAHLDKDGNLSEITSTYIHDLPMYNEDYKKYRLE
jgi:predicted phosphodiesterase